MRREAIPHHEAFNITECHNIQVDSALFKKQPLYHSQSALAEAQIHNLSKSHQAPLK